MNRLKTRKIELGYLQIDDLGKRYVLDVLNSNRLSSGRYIQEFEEKFASAHGCREGIFCNSGTSALQVSLAALKEHCGWEEGDEVLVPAVTFVATANIVLQNNLRPVFVDVDPNTYNIDPSKIQQHLSKKTKAVIPVHLFGQPCDMDPILAIARSKNLTVLEDSCETIFAKYRKRWVGSFGELACFSTYAAHILVTGVGGLITTNSKELAMICRSMIAHGRDACYLTIDDDDLNEEVKQKEIIQRRFSFVRMGYSYRATEMEAALGLAALETQSEVVTQRRQNASTLTQFLKPYGDSLQLPTVLEGAEHSFMMFPIVLRGAVPREPLVNYLEAHGIETRHMMPLLNQPFYQKRFGRLEERYPVAQRINAQGFYIGCHQGLSQDDLAYVAQVFGDYFKSSRGHSTFREI
jgi:perosamine synthetase